MARTKSYDADQVTVNFAGIPIDSGLADGEFVRIEKVNPDYNAVEGTDGEVTVSKTNSKLYRVFIRLMQSSDGNARLSAIRTLGLAGSNLAGAGPLFINDRNGTTVFIASKAWIAKPPDQSFDREAKEREWELGAVEDVSIVGGN